jgi:hypothetical protein
MDSFADVLTVLARMRAEGIVEDYAIGGAMAVSFWTEPVATQDLDVIVTLSVESHPLDPLRNVLDWLKVNRFPLEHEHVLIAGVPVQFLVAWTPLVTEAVKTAQTVPYDPADPGGPELRLIAPTYLVAMWQLDKSADTARRRERAAMLREAGLVDEDLLAALRSTHARDESP